MTKFVERLQACMLQVLDRTCRLWVSELLGDPWSVSRAEKGEGRMREMREEAQAEEQQIMQERIHSDARLESVAVLKRPLRELLPLPPAVALGHRATVREAIEVMRQNQLSCVL